jgi:ASC-1-like (ASCH) protein
MSAEAAPAASAGVSLLHDITLVSPWFELTRDGAKKFEGRLNRNQAASFRAGDVLRVAHDSDATQPAFHSRVLAVHQFKSFEEGLTSGTVPLAEALPQVVSVQAGVDIYTKFYSLEQQDEFGALFIRTERIEEKEAKECVPAVRNLSLWLQADESTEVSISQQNTSCFTFCGLL